ncbi:hypothetical protein FRB96_000393 [Tulasnella sp. 330]|nr:hypothetical protein FRB96_000393 [Tulasnella sp. 330]KAG8885338.1 hypothetical protein FRB97_001413 [Tulasnella sp. 331]
MSTSRFKPGADQNVDVIAQLDMGVRLLQGQAHWWNDELYLCHTKCRFIYNGGTLRDYLVKVKGWMDTHPHEVVTLLINNKSELDVLAFWDPVYVDSGIAAMAYVPATAIPHSRYVWPTLGHLVEAGKRFVVFMDYPKGNPVPYILPEFDYIWEDPYSQTSLEKPCKVDRPAGTTGGEKLNLINHVMNRRLLPKVRGAVRSDRKNILGTNSIQSILDHADMCAGLANGNRPNFVLVDFVDQGHVAEAVEVLNGQRTLESTAGLDSDPPPRSLIIIIIIIMSLSAAVTRILTLQGFPPELKTRDIQTAFAAWENERGGFKIKWVDDTTLMLVFMDAGTAKRAYLSTILDPPAQLISTTGDFKKTLIKPYDGPNAQAIIANVNARTNNPRAGHATRQSSVSVPQPGNGIHKRGQSHAAGSLGRTAGLDVAAANGLTNGTGVREPSPTLPSLPKMDTLNSLISSGLHNLTPPGEVSETASLISQQKERQAVGDPARRMVGHALGIPFKTPPKNEGGVKEVERSMGGLAITAE